MKPLALFIEEKGISLDELVTASGIDAKIVKAIVDGQYTPSPTQRQRLAAALDISVGDVAWGHSVPVQHLRGNGPQTGRAT
jgi:ribosome-binding protein aMBF1 (putative translation factor)